MIVTNAISGINIISATMLLDSNDGWIDYKSTIVAIVIFFASISIVGGFIVTNRVLSKTNSPSEPEPIAAILGIILAITIPMKNLN